MIRNTLGLLIVLCFTRIAFAQTVDEIIAKNLQARGGMDKLKATTTVRMTGKLSAKMGPVDAVMTMKRPNLIRMEFTINGKTIVQAFDGETAWQIVPVAEATAAQKMSPEETQSMAEDADFDGPFVNYASKGNSIEMVGKEDVQGAPAFKMKLTLKDGATRYIYFDANSYLEVKQIASQKHAGTDLQVETYMSDYRPVDGFMVAHKIENQVNGQEASTITVDKVELNVDLDDSLFHMPEAK